MRVFVIFKWIFALCTSAILYILLFIHLFYLFILFITKTLQW